MNAQRVGTLFVKEAVFGSKGFIVLAVVAPLFFTLIFSLVFGTLFSGTPELGIVAAEESEFVDRLSAEPSIVVSFYADESSLQAAVERGSVDMGIVVPADVDSVIRSADKTKLPAYVWGESLAKDRMFIGSTLVGMVRELSGQKTAFEVESIFLGDEEDVAWSDRILPFLVLITVFLGGVFLPGTSIISEKEHGTLQAMIVTPARAGEVFLAKGILATLLSLTMGIFILVLNRAFGAHPDVLIAFVALGALQAVTIGLMLGAALKDVSTLFAFWKSGGIILFMPAVVFMFPKIPQWIGKCFPTYYLVSPIVDISQNGAGWSEVSAHFFILLAIDVALIALLGLILRRVTRKQKLYV